MPTCTGIGNVTLEVGDTDVASTPTYTEITQVRNITPFNASKETVDITTLGSPNNTREFCVGITDSGELEFTILYTSDQTVFLKAIYDSDETRAYQITINTSTYVFDGVMTNFNQDEIVADDKLEQSFTVKISGGITYTDNDASSGV